MKKVFLIAAISAISFAGFSQKSDNSTKISIGAELGLPVGDMSAITSLNIGISAQADFNVASQIDLTLNAGYIKYLGKDGGDGFGVIPVLGGVKYHFSDKLYGSAQLGISFINWGGGETVSNFTFVPGIGYQVSDNFDLLLKYNSISDNGGSINCLGIRAAYTF